MSTARPPSHAAFGHVAEQQPQLLVAERLPGLQVGEREELLFAYAPELSPVVAGHRREGDRQLVVVVRPLRLRGGALGDGLLYHYFSRQLRRGDHHV